MQVQCKACKSILSASAVNESYPQVQIRCRCGAMVSLSTGSSVTQKTSPHEIKPPAPNHVAATTPPTGSSSVAYVFGAIPTPEQGQAEQSSPFRLTGDSAATAQGHASKPTAPELRLVRSDPSSATGSVAGGGESTPSSQPAMFRLVDSQPTEAKEGRSPKHGEARALRLSASSEEHEAIVASSQAAEGTSLAPQKTAGQEKVASTPVSPAVSSRTQGKKRRPGAWRQCLEHPQVRSEMMCPTCALGYCAECKKTICPTCDTPCIEASSYQKWLEQERIRARPMLDEIKTILAYPLQDPVAFFIFAFITGFFKFAALFSHRVIIFSTGILLWYSFHTLYQVASGNMKRLLPEFNDISDLTHPMRLSGAALAITWGPVLLVGVLFAMSAETTGVDIGSMVAGATGVPTETIAPPANVDERVQNEVQNLLGGIGGEKTTSDDSSAEADSSHERGAVTTKAKEPMTKHSQSPVTSVVPIAAQKAGTGLSLLLLAALFWKVAYTPVALIVAALSKNLRSVVNPRIGIDTIRRMGAVYWQVMIIYMGLTAAEWGCGKMFDFFPLVGLVGMAFVKAYIALAVGCALGLAVFKKAPELGWD